MILKLFIKLCVATAQFQSGNINPIKSSSFIGKEKFSTFVLGYNI